MIAIGERELTVVFHGLLVKRKGKASHLHHRKRGCQREGVAERFGHEYCLERFFRTGDGHPTRALIKRVEHFFFVVHEVVGG